MVDCYTTGLSNSWVSGINYNITPGSSSISDYSIFSGNNTTTSSSTKASNSTKASKLDNYITSVKDMVAEFGCTVDEAIVCLNVPDEYVDDIKAHFTEGTDKQEKFIEIYMNANPNATRADAIKAYNNSEYGIDQDGPTLSYDNYTPDQELLDDASLDIAVDRLYNSREWKDWRPWTWGTDSDESVFEEYLVSNQYSSENIVAIASKFKEKYESLSDVLDYTFKGNDEKRNEYQTIYAKALIEQIKAGNEDAIKLVCEEIKSSGQKHGLVEAIMENADSETLKIVYKNYSEISGEKKSFIDRIKDIFKGDQETKYVKAIEDAHVKIQ